MVNACPGVFVLWTQERGNVQRDPFKARGIKKIVHCSFKHGGKLMLKQLTITSLILFIAISICFAGSEPNIQEGNWEITTKMNIPAMGMDIPPMKHTQCLTKKDLIPQNSQSGQGQECTITQNKPAGNTVSWTMQCDGGHGGNMKGSGEITYNGNSFQGKIELKGDQPNSGTISHISGKRIGDCK